MSAAHETTILPECVWVSWMAEISIRVCSKGCTANHASRHCNSTRRKNSLEPKLQPEETRFSAQKQTQNATSERYSCISCASLSMERAGNPSSSCLQPECPLLSPPRDQAWGGCHIPSCACLAVPGFSVPVTSLPQVSVLTMSILF